MTEEEFDASEIIDEKLPKHINFWLNVSVNAAQKILNFLLRISSVNVTKSAGNYGFGHITEEILNVKLHF